MSALKPLAMLLGKPLLICLAAAGAGIWLMRRGKRGARTLALAGVAAAYLCATPLVGTASLRTLEDGVPAFDPSAAAGVRDIVVLGSGYDPRDGLPISAALDPDGLARVVEAVRLARRRPGSRLILSGGAPPGHIAAARGYAQLALDLGIEPSSLVILDRARDTAQEALDTAALLGSSPFVLVTSAFHMPRALRLMRRAGANPIPAPTAHGLRGTGFADRYGLIPCADGLRKTEAALHEYLGLAALVLHVN